MRLYDTMARAVVEVAPERETLTMYSCGPTVYREAHIGNLRTFLVADLIARAFRASGTPVRQVQNITDVGHMTDEVFGDAGEDRIEQAARLEDRTPAEIAAHYTALFMDDVAAIGIEPADAYPRASEHVDDMIALIERLLANGHAYEIGGSVYFDTASFAGYGKLSGNSLDALEADHRAIIVDASKKHPSDFVLWMAAGPNRVSVWESPWGVGYPGWHIECSAMSIALLGERFDLHTGGEDNVFPHHEDEIAQSEGATGERVVAHWVHAAHVLADGRKMSKSARNDLTLRDLADRGHRDPKALRLLFLQSRYRGQTSFSFEALRGAERALDRWRQRFAACAASPDGPDPERVGEVARRFDAAIDADLDTPAALGVVSETLGSSALSDADRLALARHFDRVLGLDLTPADDAVPPHVRALADRRSQAREARDFVAADALRDELRRAGFEIVDTPAGPSLRRVTV